MRPRARGFIGQQEATYIQLLLGHVDPAGKERGLERLCAHYHRGLRLRSPHPIQQTLTALLYRPEPNVRRWALNAIAAAGSRGENLQAVLDAIERDRTDDDILAAGIGALIALTKQDERAALLGTVDIALEGPTLLAAAQQADTYQGDLSAQRVNIDSASPSELRLASVLVGLDKAPDHLFSLSHPNSAVIGRLNLHDDALVAQYSAWAILESNVLDVTHLGTPVKDIEARPERVRAYTYRIISADSVTAERYREFIELGSVDTSQRAREGLASGLNKAYFDGIEEITLDWYDQERDANVKEAILDHMASQSPHSEVYLSKVTDEYLAAGTGSMKRARLEAASEGLPIFGKLKRISLQAETLSLFGNGQLFGGRMTNYTINAENLNVGVLAGDNASIEGGVTAGQTNNIAEARQRLHAL